MKKTIAMMMAMTIATMMAGAADNVITNYLPNYRMVANVTTNAGDTGLSTGVTYYCFAAADVAQLTEAQGTHTNGSYPQLMFAINEALYTGWGKVATTNRSAMAAFGRKVTSGVTGDVSVVHSLSTLLTVTGKLDVVSE